MSERRSEPEPPRRDTRGGMRRRGRRDDGSALVEFVWLAILLLIPLVYVVLTAAAVQRTAFGLTTAAREAGRAYATAGSDDLGEARAEAAVSVAMRDQGAGYLHRGRVIRCGDCDYAPGSSYTVELHARVALPLVPHWMCAGRCLAGIPISVHHTERLSCYSGTGPPDPSGTC